MNLFVPTDLHGHTLNSDGRASPEEYVEFRRRLGLRVIALSDHDVLAGVRRGAEAARHGEMLFVPALEVTSFLHFGTERAEQFHVLAYFPPHILDDRRLEETFLYRRGERVQAAWKAHVLVWLRALPEEQRLAIDPEGELEQLPPPRFPALQSMIERVVARHRPLFESFRDHHVGFWDDRELFAWTPEEAIEAIRGDGATDIVAHPVRYRDKERTEAVIQHATGLEVYTSRHKAEVAASFRAMADRLGKHWTASSDDHQNAPYARPPSGTPVRTVERILHQAVPVSMIVAG